MSDLQQNETKRNATQNDRTAADSSLLLLIVTTRKIAARVSGADTGCATAASVSEVVSAIDLSAAVLLSGRRPRIKTYLLVRTPRRFAVFSISRNFAAGRGVS